MEKKFVVAVSATLSDVGKAVLRGVTVAAGKFGWSLEIINPGLTDGDFRPFAKTLREADGVIVRLKSNCQMVRPFLRDGIPVVGIDIETFPDSGLWVTLLPDNARIGAVAAEELLSKGLKCHALVPTLPRLEWGEARNRGFCDRIRAAGGQVRIYEPRGMWKSAEEHGALARWLAALPRPFGLFACNDMLARFALDACKSAGIGVPGEAMIVGADNDEGFCRYCSPSLTSVQIDHEGAGRRAAEALRGFFDKPRPKRPVTMRFGPCGVARRASTHTASSEMDLRLAAGLDFITAHADNAFIGVDDVSAAMGLGRRQAERLFLAAGMSIRRKIEETRLAHVRTLLATTGFPLRRIAAECGFYSEIYLAGLFRRRFGTTPGAWRRERAGK